MTNVLHQFKRKYQYFALSILSGILVGTSYIPFPAWAVFFCYIPLWFSLISAENEKVTYKKLFFMSWITQFVFTLIGFNWIYYTASEFGHLPPLISGLALILFASLMHIYIPLSATLASYLKRKFNLSNAQYILLFPILFSLAERMWPSIFQWNLGYTLLWMKWPIAQWADTVGFLGLSSVILFIQAVLLIGILNYKVNNKNFLFSGVFVIFFTTLASITGLQKEKKWTQTNESVNFTLVQANVGNTEKLISELGPQFQKTIVQKYISQVEDYLSKQTQSNPKFYTDIILWPETAMPLALDLHFALNPLQNLIQSKVKSWNSVLVTGAYSHDQFKKDQHGDVLTRNAVFFLGPNGPQQPAYFKSELLAFGEYLPFGEFFPSLYKLLPFVGTFEKGPGPVSKKIQLANQKTVILGPQICYESLDPEFSRGLSKKGADVIINITNDSWFGDWAEPYQHMIMTLARGLEVRRPLVRDTNTGFSSVILANGNILEKSNMNQQWTNTYTINYLKNAPLSDYTRWGHYDWVILIFILLFILITGSDKGLKND